MVKEDQKFHSTYGIQEWPIGIGEKKNFIHDTIHLRFLEFLQQTGPNLSLFEHVYHLQPPNIKKCLSSKCYFKQSTSVIIILALDVFWKIFYQIDLCARRKIFWQNPHVGKKPSSFHFAWNFRQIFFQFDLYASVYGTRNIVSSPIKQRVSTNWEWANYFIWQK